MVDKTKFKVENVIINETILENKFVKKRKSARKNKEWFVFDYSKSEFLDFFKAIKAKPNESEDEENLEKEYLTEEEKFVNKNYKYLSIVFVRDIGAKEGMLIIHQNLRKDYMRIHNPGVSGTLNDLNYEAFVEIVDLYAKEFEIPKNKFWDAKVTKVEFGVTIPLKSNMTEILSCFGTLKNVPEKFIYGNSGISYKAENFSVDIYDKLKRVIQNGEILNTRTKTKNENFRKLVKRKFYFLRFELRVDSVSKFNQSSFKDKINTLKNIKDNWNNIARSLHNISDDISFVDFISPEIEKELISSQIDSKSKAPFDDYMFYLAVKKMGGMDLFRRHIAPMINKSTKSAYIRKCELAYNKFVEFEKNSYQYIFDKKFEYRIKRLLNREGSI